MKFSGSSNRKIEQTKFTQLNQALKEYLPELLIRNKKLGQRLKSKIEVNFLLNNIELRNQSYLKKLIASSENTLQNIKSGVDLNSSTKLTQKKLSPLNYQILDDYFLRKNNIISNTKRNLLKSTEEESNAIIKSNLHIIKHYLNPTNVILEKPKLDLPKKKYLSQPELIEAEKVINNKIKQEELGLNSRLKKYLDRVKKIKLTIPKNSNEYDPIWIKENRDKNKDFYFYADHFSLNNKDVKMIHYKKLEPIPIRDKSCPNIIDINIKLFPDIKEGLANKDNYLNIQNKNSVKIINDMEIQKRYAKRKLLKNIGDIDINFINVNNNKNDSYNTLNRIVVRNKSLTNMSSIRYKKLSALMDLELPKISDYDSLINKKKKSIQFIGINEDNNSNNNLNNDNNKIKLIKKQYHQWKLIPEINAIKAEIQTLQAKKLDIEENYKRHKEELANKTYIIPDIPLRKKEKIAKNKLTIGEGLFNLNLKNPFNSNNANRSSIISSYENNSMRMPSSYSMKVLKRKSIITDGINTFLENKINPEISINSREKTNVTSIIQSVRNSANVSKISNKKEKKFEGIMKKMNKDDKNNNAVKPKISLKGMKIDFNINDKINLFSI